jgi:hypothetical protein
MEMMRQRLSGVGLLGNQQIPLYDPETVKRDMPSILKFNDEPTLIEESTVLPPVGPVPQLNRDMIAEILSYRGMAAFGLSTSTIKDTPAQVTIKECYKSIDEREITNLIKMVGDPGVSLTFYVLMGDALNLVDVIVNLTVTKVDGRFSVTMMVEYPVVAGLAPPLDSWVEPFTMRHPESLLDLVLNALLNRDAYSDVICFLPTLNSIPYYMRDRLSCGASTGFAGAYILSMINALTYITYRYPDIVQGILQSNAMVQSQEHVDYMKQSLTPDDLVKAIEQYKEAYTTALPTESL